MPRLSGGAATLFRQMRHGLRDWEMQIIVRKAAVNAKFNGPSESAFNLRALCSSLGIGMIELRLRYDYGRRTISPWRVPELD
jgi:hypothetical protein